MSTRQKKKQDLDTEDQQQPKQTSLSRQEKYNLVILILLYSVQGITIGFFVQAVQMLLTEKGASNIELSIFSFILYPFSFKLIFAPIEDTFYWKRFGKRKSYIVPLQYCLGILMYYSSFRIQEWIEQKDISQLTLVGNIAQYIYI